MHTVLCFLHQCEGLYRHNGVKWVSGPSMAEGSHKAEWIWVSRTSGMCGMRLYSLCGWQQRTTQAHDRQRAAAQINKDTEYFFYCLHLKMPQIRIANNLIVSVLQLINFISVFPHGSFSGNTVIFAYLCHSDLMLIYN